MPGPGWHLFSFFTKTMNTEVYLEVLMELCSALQSDTQLQAIVHFQQDGAPPHFATATRDFLNAHFKNWIGRRGHVEWPACSTDLTPCDFCIVGVLKEQQVFHHQFCNVVDLKCVI